jgi:chromosome partitioning protein
MRRIAVINQKGGVGKTTTCANLGAALALQGRRVVLVDMDAQANLSLSLDISAESGSPTSYSVLLGEQGFGASLRPTRVPGLALLPANIDLSGAEMELASAIGREFLLRDALRAWVDEERKRAGRAPADYVLFDCPPSLGLLSINALAAAGEVLITLQTEFLALQGMSKLVEIVQLLRKRLNPELAISGILPCLYDSRLKLAREVLGEIRRYFPGQVLPQPIRANVKLAEAPSYGKTIFEYAPDSNGADDYMKAAREILRGESRDPELAQLPAFREQVAPPPGAEIAPAPRRVPPPRRAPAPMVSAAPAPAVSVAPAPAPTQKQKPVLRAEDLPPLPPDVFEVLTRRGSRP